MKELNTSLNLQRAYKNNKTDFCPFFQLYIYVILCYNAIRKKSIYFKLLHKRKDDLYEKNSIMCFRLIFSSIYMFM